MPASETAERLTPASNGSGPRSVAVLEDIALPGTLASVAKRAFDLCIAILAILVLSPLMIAIAILVKLDSPGPVFYRSKRTGRNGEPLRMLKFRTMVDGADRRRAELRHMTEAPDGLFKIQHDPRLTRFGAILRSTSLDELPQLFHVLSGRMSLVGPRPLPPEEDRAIVGAMLRRHARPGITGPWQLAGSWRVPMTRMVELDEEYLANWSLWLDTKLLAQTIVPVVRRVGV